jgi:hypothetical protein
MIFPCHAADVGCDSTYDGTGFRDEESNRQRWPLGFRPKAGMCATGYIVGDIQPGDFEKVRKVYSGSHPYLFRFLLNSPGGDVDEAIKIGRFFRKYLLNADAPVKWFGISQMAFAEKVDCPGSDESKCLCASACSLIWFGAVHRVGRVGLHRPWTDSAAFRNAGPAEAESEYKRKMKEISNYLDEMEVPNSVAQKLLSTSSSDISWVDAEEGLELSPSFEEWTNATCGRISPAEHVIEKKIASQQAGGRKLSSNDQVLLKLLQEKDSKHGSCVSDIQARGKEALPVP